jgi:hypothetical protein
MRRLGRHIYETEDQYKPRRKRERRVPLHLLDHGEFLGVGVVDALVPLMLVLLVRGVHAGDATLRNYQ